MFIVGSLDACTRLMMVTENLTNVQALERIKGVIESIIQAESH